MMPIARPFLRLAADYLRRRALGWTEARLRDHQRRRLARQLAYIGARSPFYRELFPAGPASLAEVPAMDKRQMMERFDDINTAGLVRDDLIAFRIEQERLGLTDLYQGRYAVGLSSGTSGNKVLTVLSPSERRRYAMLLWARAGLPPGIPSPRVLFALRTNNPAFVAVTRLGVTLRYVDYFVPVADLVDLINTERLNVVTGPPSLLTSLAEHAAQLRSPIDAVISYAEELDDATRRRIGASLGAPVTEIYQGAEGMLGFSCPDGHLHLSEDVCLFEFTDAGDPLGNARAVIVTDLYRRTQPFIRYQLGDLLEIGGRDCSCGSAFRRITRIHGRSDSVFILPSKTHGTVRLMPDYVRRSINQASGDVLEYQAIQRSPTSIEIRVELANGANAEAIRSAIRTNLAHWADRAGAHLGSVTFSDVRPTRDPDSHKLVRVIRRSP